MKTDSKKGAVLYRKHRPQIFDEVIGQESVVKVLSGEINTGNISHAYLFSGSRGTGKTSVARIFAKEIGTSLNDLYELDAASNRGIDDIRAIRESVSTLPFDSKYKVYIFDEVHMLTKEAWNAFLKTLEEPPAHVVFILATTDLDKVPETVISRCQTFLFKSPNRKLLREFVENIGKKEGIKIETDAAELIALLGDGSYRDAHGILEKVIASTSDKKVRRIEVEEVTGAPKARLIEDVISSVVLEDIERGMKAIKTATSENIDIKVFARLILEKLRYVFLLRLKAGMDEYIKEETSEDDFNFLNDLAAKAGPKLTGDTLIKFIDAYEKIGNGSIPQLPLELALADSIRQDR